MNAVLNTEKSKISDFTEALDSRSENFSLKIGNTVYEVSTHFNTDGRLSVIQQFEQLILNKDLI